MIKPFKIDCTTTKLRQFRDLLHEGMLILYQWDEREQGDLFAGLVCNMHTYTAGGPETPDNCFDVICLYAHPAMERVGQWAGGKRWDYDYRCILCIDKCLAWAATHGLAMVRCAMSELSLMVTFVHESGVQLKLDADWRYHFPRAAEQTPGVYYQDDFPVTHKDTLATLGADMCKENTIGSDPALVAEIRKRRFGPNTRQGFNPTPERPGGRPEDN